jgi:hypothetical protein
MTLALHAVAARLLIDGIFVLALMLGHHRERDGDA